MPEKFQDVDEISKAHIKRYNFSLDFCKNKTVLDIACGDGYGSNILAGSSAMVVGIDIDEETIDIAKKKYINSKLQFEVGDVQLINYPDNFFDLAVSFETIEHVDRKKQILFLREVNRVLKPNGIFIISTPDKDIEGEGHNHFHVCEMNRNGFLKLLRNRFSVIDLYAQGVRKYKNKFVLSVFRVIHFFIKLDHKNFRHYILPKSFRFKINNQLLNSSTSSFANNNKHEPIKINESETGSYLIAVCKK